MKFTLAFLFFLQLSSMALSQVKSDLDLKLVKGKVKSTVENNYGHPTKINGKLQNGKLTFIDTNKYNAKGMLNYESRYDRILRDTDPFKLQYKNVYTFDGNGNKTEMNFYHEGNCEQGGNVSQYKYDVKGRIIQETRGFRANTINSIDGNYQLKTTFIYDENGNNVEAKKYNDKNILTLIDSFKYDSANHLVEHRNYWRNLNLADSRFELLSSDFYKYDHGNNLTEVKHYYSDGTIDGIDSYEYKQFDKQGNWLIKIVFEIGVYSVVERKIEYY